MIQLLFKRHHALLLIKLLIVGVAVLPLAVPAVTLKNGWYTQNNNIIWGYGQFNSFWKAGYRPNLTRNAPGEVKPNRTENLPQLTDNMLNYGYPAFEHTPGLWYDRRRDAHNTDCPQVGGNSPEGPFLEMPWARGSSGQGQACDQGPKFDLQNFNPWYFQRLKDFSALSDSKGTLLLHNFYLQHYFLERQTHYVDYPWRPGNSIQSTGMPSNFPAANAFWDVSNSTRMDLHRLFIEKGLDELAAYGNVLHTLCAEYTGPQDFMEFYIDTIVAWENRTNNDAHIVLGATKDVLDAILADPQREPQIDSIDLRYFWYTSGGSLFAWKGGQEDVYRLEGNNQPSLTTPEMIYRQVREYRDRYPDKGIIHKLEATRQQTWAFLMGGGSLLVRKLIYPNGGDPASYVAPQKTELIQPLYDFIQQYLLQALPNTKPADIINGNPNNIWALAAPDQLYMVYALNGGNFQVDLSASTVNFGAKWLNPRTGAVIDVANAVAPGTASFVAPDNQDWALIMMPNFVGGTSPPLQRPTVPQGINVNINTGG